MLRGREGGGGGGAGARATRKSMCVRLVQQKRTPPASRAGRGRGDSLRAERIDVGVRDGVQHSDARARPFDA